MGLFGGGNSSQSTTNLSQTQTQDRRVVADGGSTVLNTDNSNVGITQISNTTDFGAISAALQSMLQAVGLSSQVADKASLYGAQSSQYAVGTIGNVADTVAGVSSHLGDVGLSMLQANTALTNSLGTKVLDTGSQELSVNTALANSLANGSNNLVTHVLDVASGLYRDAASGQQQTTQIAADLAKTQVAAQNDNRYLIAAGLAVIGIVGVMAFKGKA
jgi:hypothetical protein